MPGYIGRDHLHTYTCTRPVKFPSCHYGKGIFLFRLEIISAEITEGTEKKVTSRIWKRKA